MKNTLMTMLVAATILTGACANDSSSPVAETTASGTSRTAVDGAGERASITPEQLGELGAEIEKQPERARELLSRRGLDEKSFEQEIRKVTESPEASKRYAEAYKKAKA